MDTQQVYVLIRTKWQFWFGGLFKKRYRHFKDALESALRQDNKNGEININIIILRDSWWQLSEKPHRVRLPKFCKDVISNFSSQWISTNKTSHKIFFYSCNSKGAAHSLYNIREILFKKRANNNDIAVVLDDDDIFYSSTAIASIVEQMNNNKAQVCVSKFEIIGQSAQNIINRGGMLHNRLAEDGDKRGELSPSSTDLFGKGSLCFVDSLCWAKSYRVGVLRNYHDDLLTHFKSRKRLISFLQRNDAYEDFPEIINLCRKGVKVVGLNANTHAYRKHSKSITSSPKRVDFTHKRPEYLALLVALYERLNKKGELAKDADWVIARYCVVKMLTIENILARYRSDDQLHWQFVKLEKGYFIRQILHVFRQKRVLNTFVELLKKVDLLEIYNSSDKYYKYRKYAGKDKTGATTADSPFKVLCNACHNEAYNGRVDISNLLCDNSTRTRVNILKNSYVKYILATIVGIIIITIALIIARNLYNQDAKMLSVITAITIPLIAWLYSLVYKDNAKLNEQKKYNKLFCESVNELERHVIAGLANLMTIKQQMKDNEAFRPAKIHFTNLKVLPSIIPSDWDNRILVNEFNKLPNLRVNIRNIDNSACYMEEYVDRADYKHNEMLQIIEWEMVRYLSYITRFKFFADKKSFILPDTDKLFIYVLFDDVIKNIATKIHIDGVDEKSIEQEIETYFNRFLEDRNVLREILTIG